MQFDYLIVGSGITGATLARLFTDNGYKVLILERRNHLGGNVHDRVHESGIRIHTYGPHYFRTSSEKIWTFVNRFVSFYPYKAQVKTLVDGQIENWPVTSSYIKKVVPGPWQPGFKGTPTNFEEASLALMPPPVYHKFVKGYTEKQWGLPAHKLSPNLVKRFDVREDDNPYLTPHHKYQGLPVDGYTSLMANLLAGIPVHLKFDYLENREVFTPARKTFFTGPIDEYFNFELGRLGYRSQQREHIYLPDVEYFQPYGQINNPNPTTDKFIRTLEWKHLMQPELARQARGTLITRETPITPTNPQHYEYPFPDEENDRLYRRYLEKAYNHSNVVFCGRLGEYRYFDMDQAIGRAMALAHKEINSHSYLYS